MRKLVAGLAVAVAVLIGAEMSLRAFGVEAAYQPDPFGGWVLSPDMRDHRMQSTVDAHDFVMNTNSDGLRTALTRDDDVAIALMGDSTVFGWGLDEGDTLADGLSEALGVNVLNAGQPGYSTDQVGVLWDTVVRHYEPDHVVVFLPMHDHVRVRISDRELREGASSPGAWLRIGLNRHSRIYGGLVRAIFPGGQQLQPIEQSAEPRVSRVSSADRDAVLERIAAETQLSTGVLPFYSDLARPVGETPMPRHGMGSVDLDLRPCCGPDADALVFSFDQHHLNAKGTRRVAEALAEALQ